MSLEINALFSVVRALVAGNKLGFGTEDLLDDLQKALGIDEETYTDILCKADEDPEACLLKSYGNSEVAAPQTAPSQQAGPFSARPQPSTALPAAAAYPDPSYSQPSKKQRKSLPTPSAAPATAPRASRPAPNSKSRASARSAPTTPAAGAGSVSHSQQPKVKLGISVQALQRALHRGQAEVQTYLHELNQRERAIFTELISLGVDENSSDLSEVHKVLIQWYKLDSREAAIEQELLAGAVA